MDKSFKESFTKEGWGAFQKCLEDNCVELSVVNCLRKDEWFADVYTTKFMEIDGRYFMCIFCTECNGKGSCSIYLHDLYEYYQVSVYLKDVFLEMVSYN
jgi:hypothetical protein